MFWEQQFGLNVDDATDSAKLGADGYANVEHYFNNTDPRGGAEPIVFVSATVSRALVKQGQAGEWKIERTGNTAQPLEVAYDVSGNAKHGQDFDKLPGTVTIPAGQRFAVVRVQPLATARDDRTVVLTLKPGQTGMHPGCPSASLVVIRQ